MLPSPFARFFAMSIAPFFGSHNTYHTLRRKATDSSKEIDFFENAFIESSSAKCTRVLNCLLRFLGQRSAIVNHSKMCYLLRRSVHTEFYTFHTKGLFMSTIKSWCHANAMLVISLLAAIVTAFFVPPDRDYLGYYDLKTLACLFCVLAVVVLCGICISFPLFPNGWYTPFPLSGAFVRRWWSSPCSALCS